MKNIELFFLFSVIIWLTLFNPLLGCSSNNGEIINTQYSRDIHLMPGSKIPEHHTKNGFQNSPYVKEPVGTGPSFYLRRIWHSIFLHDVPEEYYLSEAASIKLRKTITGDGVTWLGHSTFLIRLSGKTILTDPFLTKFASPFSWGGPQRMVPPGISLKNLPPIDIIIVSHNHYDHLDDETIRKLPDKDTVQVVVPLGLKSFFLERGYTNITELDWHDEIKITDIKLVSLPAVHHSGRTLSDRNKSLWSSWAIASFDKKLYFTGDSAYSDSIFKKIGETRPIF